MDFSISAKKNSYIFLITVGVLNTLIAIFMYHYLKDRLVESIYEKNIELAKIEFKKTNKYLNKELTHYKLILENIKKSYYFKSYINSPDKKEFQEILIHDFENFINANENIFQLRYLDKKGIEKIRIDKVNGKSEVVTELQDKSKRYYFTKTKTLENNKFYISDFDLNIEYGRIEIPFRPNIRLATPIYKDETFLGVLIINYNAKELLELTTQKSLFDVYYMDSKGNFLLHPDPKKSWSTQLNTNFKVKDEIKNIDYLLSHRYKDKNWIYYLDKVSITDKDFSIIYSIKKEIYEREINRLKEEILILFFIIFLLTLPIVFVGAYLQSFQMKILEILIDTLPFPVALKNNKGKFVLVNKSLVRLYGYKKKKDILGKISYDFNAKNLPYTDENKDKSVLLKKLIKFEDTIEHEKGKTLYFDTRLIKISFLGMLHKDYILGIAIDITELKVLNRELERRVHEELRKRIRTEKQLAQKAKLAEIGNLIDNIMMQWELPLNLISLSVQAIELENEQQHFNKENLLNQIKNIKENTQYMFNTTEDMKVFLSLDKGIELFNISDIVAKVERILKGRLKQEYIEIDKNIDKNITITGYKNEFSQIILNLLNNAIDEFELNKKTNSDKKINIEVKKESNFVHILISDNAGGIEKDELNKIFDENYSLKNNIGNGLAICKRIIEDEFKGEIFAYSKNSKAVFEIKIPS